MLFSIVIPAYNYAHLLPRAIESALAQSGEDYEVLVIDDGSTDATPEVVAELQRQHPRRFIYLRQENRGAAAVRNRGVRETRGEYLLFLDADDRLLPDALERFRQFLAGGTRWGMVCAGHRSVHPDGRIRNHPAKEPSLDRRRNFCGYIRKKFGISNGATIMARRVFERVQYPELVRSSEDIPVFAQVLALYDCAALAEPVLEVHKHDDSLRHNLPLILKAGTGIVDILFDPAILPAEFMGYRREFEARQHLSLFRSLYLARRYPQARQEYLDGLRLCPSLLFDLSHLRKFLRTLGRS
jgi:glycosyltransferase involved in cell wall biosynthesis